jgi:excisionase family DNA binding protein
MAHTRKAAGTRPKADPWLSLPQAAALLGRHRQTVAHMAARGEIGSQTVGGRLYVARADIGRLAREQDEAEKAVA